MRLAFPFPSRSSQRPRCQDPHESRLRACRKPWAARPALPRAARPAAHVRHRLLRADIPSAYGAQTAENLRNSRSGSLLEACTTVRDPWDIRIALPGELFSPWAPREEPSSVRRRRAIHCLSGRVLSSYKASAARAPQGTTAWRDVDADTAQCMDISPAHGA